VAQDRNRWRALENRECELIVVRVYLLNTYLLI
jgi:hypothetical protein